VATARVTVNPVAAARNVTPQLVSEEDLFANNVNDVFFDFDKANIQPNEVNTAKDDGSFLVQHPEIKILVEGHCDDRGSEEYNLALGASRANILKNSLEAQGVNDERIKTISYGKEKPFCTVDNAQCWQQNRRDHVVFEH
jgi:peptidoglycan-associated lipoprotein